MQWLLISLRCLMGCWFAYSGGLKIFGTGLDRFTRDVANYKIVAAPWDAVAAYTVPWVEVVVGVCLLLAVLRRGTILVTAGMVTVFVGCIGWAWWHRLDISCGCHGSDAAISYWSKVVEFSSYYAVLALLVWGEFFHQKADDSRKIENMA